MSGGAAGALERHRPRLSGLRSGLSTPSVAANGTGDLQARRSCSNRTTSWPSRGERSAPPVRPRGHRRR